MIKLEYNEIVGSPLPQNELLKAGGQFTAVELTNLGSGPNGPKFLYVREKIKARILPLSLVDLAIEKWEGEDHSGAIESIFTSFWVYRECVCRLEALGNAPIVRKPDGVWEWPEPVGFAWGDENTKLLAMLMGAYERGHEASVVVADEDLIQKVTASGVVSVEKAHDLVTRPHMNIRFEVPSLEDIRMMWMQTWQNYCVKNWIVHNHIGKLFGFLLEGGLPEFKGSLVPHLEEFKRAMNWEALRYAKEGEAGGGWQS